MATSENQEQKITAKAAATATTRSKYQKNKKDQ